MSQSLVQATCPRCQRKLKIAGTMLEAIMRCKFCGAVFRRAKPVGEGQPVAITGRAQAVAELTVPSRGDEFSSEASTAPMVATLPAASARITPAIPPPTPEVHGSELMAKYYQRRKRRLRINLGIAAGILAALGVTAFVCWDELSEWYQNKVNPLAGQIAQALEDEPKKEPSASDKKSAAPGDAKAEPPKPPDNLPPAKPEKKGNPDPRLLDDKSPDKPAKRARPRSGSSDPRPMRITGYPGRALFVGVKNYLYANPVNPGYRADNSIAQDPLGFKQLRTALIRDFGFPMDQVGELSDVAAKNPTPPIKATIEKTVAQFLDGSRPQDRVVLVFMGHATEATTRHFFYDENQAYLVPIEADPTDAAGLIPLSWLYEQLAKCKARQKLLILDVAHFDPEQGMTRAGGEALKPSLMKEVERVPQGVQVWVSCSPGEHSYQFASNGYQGSLFMDTLLKHCDLGFDDHRAILANSPLMKEGTLPLAILAPEVNKKVTEVVKQRADATQTPRFFGKEGPAPESTVNAPAPTVTVAVGGELEKVADKELIAGIIKELDLGGDQSGAVNADALPPFWAKNVDAYAADYKTEQEFKDSLKMHALRESVVQAAKAIGKHDLAFDKGFKFGGDEGRFKKMLEQAQQKPATIEQELDEAQAKLDVVAKDRAKEVSKRWQAHYDFVYARLLAKKIYVREYNFVLGNKLKKDAPVIKNKSNNGWVIIPTEKMQQKETREWEKKRQALLDKLVKEHPGTPWEVLARRERSAFLGLTIQEAKVD